MYPALALILVGLAAFTTVVVWRHDEVEKRQISHKDPDERRNGRWAGVDRERIRGFAYVGAGALVVLAVTVVAVGIFRPEGSGEMLAVLGLFAYVAYVAAAFGVGWWQTRSQPRRAATVEPAPKNSHPMSDERPR